MFSQKVVMSKWMKKDQFTGVFSRVKAGMCACQEAAVRRAPLLSFQHSSLSNGGKPETPFKETRILCDR